jgi:hypothetical protein
MFANLDLRRPSGRLPHRGPKFRVAHPRYARHLRISARFRASKQPPRDNSTNAHEPQLRIPAPGGDRLACSIGDLRFPWISGKRLCSRE